MGKAAWVSKVRNYSSLSQAECLRQLALGYPHLSKNFGLVSAFEHVSWLAGWLILHMLDVFKCQPQGKALVTRRSLSITT